MSKAQLGGYDFNFEVTRIRNAANVIADGLSKILNNNPGPQTIVALVAKMALQIPIILDAVQNMEKIGREARSKRTE